MTTDPNSEIAKTIGLDAASARRKKLKRKIYWGLALLAVVLLLVKWNMDSGDAEIQFKTRPVKKGSITITVTATGNLTPTNQVEVGSELSGIVDTVDADFNDQVAVGQVLAKLDTSRLDAEVLQARAMLASARAKVLQAKATVNESRNQLKRLEAVRELSNDRAVSQQDIETAQAIMDRAAADKASANAGVDQAKASLEAIETDLSKTVIRSPINGIVLARSVEPGQTVAASLQAPVLFTLAEDLTKMELNVDVDEADVAQVKEGQDADFTVDAYPDKTFPAKITQVRYGPKTVAGVVTYETILNVDNSDLLLRPGMTATADIIVNKIEDAILVPNAVLRFDPPEIEETADNSRRGVMRLFPSRKHPAKKRTELHPDRSHQLVWTQKNGELISIDVVTGESDGSMTEIKSGDVTPGMELVVDMINTGK
jgi:HlyD family secretion protein